MTRSDLDGLLALSRRRTLELLDAVAAAPDPAALLAWRPGPGRAHLAWQFMHVAATQDKHLHTRMTAGRPQHPDYVRRFASGSVPDDDVPPLATVRDYLAEQLNALLVHIRSLPEAALAAKPNEQAPHAYAEWLQVLALHEAYHHGQAHLTYNLYRTARDDRLRHVGH